MFIPADIPQSQHKEFTKNYQAITGPTGNLMLFAADQKIEHLNAPFYGADIPAEVKNPEHLFKIASAGSIGAFATQLGLIARYGLQYAKVNYIVKLNSKTNIIPHDAKDPMSTQLWSVADVVNFKLNSNLPIRGIGYTVYLGSKHEHGMLAQAAQAVYEAHQHGLIAMLWMYPRGKHVADEKQADLIAGAAGVANCLGADFVKINVPTAQGTTSSAQLLQRAVGAAGNTKVICSGGILTSAELFLTELHEQLHTGGTAGNATGRNIFQRTLADAVAYTHAINAIVNEGKNAEQALTIYNSKK